MRRSIMSVTLLAAFSILMIGCTPAEEPDNVPPRTPSPTATPTATASPTADDKKTAASLTGRWQGQDGTYVNITEKDGKYSIELANLDGPKTYEGTAKGDEIEFTRDGKTETIKAATGEETGMKYLQEKKNCVVITKGSEGFCRD
ncbi:MAG TPA: hypothetical protein VK918_03400 [Pyrinomonadaceae bacterium]|nr:hypothetical protein [Pyrinomonadaceae bacterium]